MSKVQPQLDTPRHTQSVGIRALKQNASQVIARVTAGESIEVTDRGRPVARIIPLQRDPYQELVDAGAIFEPTVSLDEFFRWQSSRQAALESIGESTTTAPKLTSEQLLDEQREDRF